MRDIGQTNIPDEEKTRIRRDSCQGRAQIAMAKAPTTPINSRGAHPTVDLASRSPNSEIVQGLQAPFQ